jgi:pyridoxine 5-phosphate synthase
MPLLLGVNLDHVATLRQARYTDDPWCANAEPCPVLAGHEARAGGADSITVHVRGDRRHMQERDALRLRGEVGLPLNFEMGVTEEMIAIALRLKPQFACLVPETRQEITTEGGLDVAGGGRRVCDAVAMLRDGGIRVSLFIDPELGQVEASAATGAEMVELHTGAFANASGAAQDHEYRKLCDAAEGARQAGLQVNAGHGINYQNIVRVRELPHLVELNIGHSIVSRAVFVGMRSAVTEMKALMVGDGGGER